MARKNATGDNDRRRAAGCSSDVAIIDGLSAGLWDLAAGNASAVHALGEVPPLRGAEAGDRLTE